MNPRTDEAFICQCVSDTLDGIRDGLSHYSGPSRAAVIYSLSRNSPLYICDPQHLLNGHETKFKQLYLEDDSWRRRPVMETGKAGFSNMYPEPNLELAGLISYGGRSGTLFYQMWFTEHHPDMCSVGPTERWLEHAAWRLSHDIANEKELYTGISGSFLREYATHAVRDHIIDEMNMNLGWDSHIRVYQLLDAVLGISKTLEEGAWPRGELFFIEPSFIDTLDFLVGFKESEQPLLEHFKHVRKLLMAVENSDLGLVSDGRSILGVCLGKPPVFSISADFKGRHGFLKINGNNLCSFSDGSFKSTTHQAKLVQVEESLLESDIDAEIRTSLFKIISSLVHHAENHKHGCTLVIDLNPEPVFIAGQSLDKPIDLCQPDFLNLAKSLSKVDGALQIGIDLHLHGFACLLDGRTIPGEDRARGARYNSALRFSAEHPGIIVVVVSSDRPVSVIQEGVEISAQCQWNPMTSCTFRPETLQSWINHSDEH